MAVRLSSFIREQVLVAVLNHAFEAREKAQEAEKIALGDAVYNDTYPEAVREQMAALPNGFLPVSTGLKVQFEGRTLAQLPFGGRRRIAHTHEYNAAKVYDSKHPLAVRYGAWKDAEGALKRERRDAESSAKAVLESVTTVNKLIQVWPEVEPFARFYAVESPSRAVALPIKDLNARPGLPPQTASA